MSKFRFILILLISISAVTLYGQDQDGKVAGYSCNACHSEAGWKNLRSDMSFNHNDTSFPLEGRHASLRCMQCHTGNTYTEIHNFASADNACQSCHTDIHEGQLGSDCQQCHSSTSWTDARSTFNHDQTQFPLVGVHKSVDCQACHDLTDPQSIANVPLTCYGCHVNDYNNAKQPDHRAGGFPTTCEDCHAVNDPNWQASNFNHDQTGFPLEQAHTQVKCEDCHTGPNYSTPGSDCISCHNADYQSAGVNHELAGFSTNCTTCHRVTTWSDVTWDHATEANYALEGQHTSVACLDCHVNNNFKVENTCNACHDPSDYTGIIDHQKAFDSYSNCEDCHPGPEGWTPTEWVHQTETGYALTGSHISVTCLNCHVDNNFNVTSDCYSCHQQDYESTRNTEVDHIAQNFPTTCETCHNTTTWSDATFDHDATNFPLTGAHTEATCNDCHSSGIYAGLPTDCASCHIDQYNSVANPPHAEAGFAADNCESCHTTDAFTPSTWNHTQETNFTIDGSHVSLTCNECHDGTFINYQPDGTTECVTCHRADYDNASIHQQFGFGTNCIDCHNTTTFSDAEFDHDGRYFPIYSGRHQGLWNNDCSTCHTDPNDQSVFTCLSSGCHSNSSELQSQHSEVSGYVYESSACYACHPTGNSGDSFDHATTGFPLEGQHQVITCDQCHVNGDFQTPLDPTCVNCHQDNYNQTSNPNHSDAGFSTDCVQCHTAETFTTSTWDHANETGFALTGGHAAPTCNSCHDIINYNSSDVSCVSCHLDDYNSTTDPNHSQSGFSTNCENCHNSTSDWSDAEFDHDSRYFPIYSGRHQGLWNNDCSTCHTDPNDQSVFSCLSSGCHSNSSELQSQHSEVSSYVYESSACYACHPTGSSGDSFDHATTGFPLEGQHQVITCDQCHVNGDFQTQLDPTCVSCHQDNYDQTSNPNHSDAGFGTDCLLCHTAESFTTTTWDHSNETGFALTSGHASSSCNDCHDIIHYNSTSVSCASCHQEDYAQTTNPNHSDAGFSNVCAQCHTTDTFTTSTWNHNSETGFALTGGHATPSCNTCHDVISYSSTNVTCVSCHLSDYNSTTDPNHSQAGFPTTCADCHTSTSDWGDANFDHDQLYFPIYSGRHQGRWTTCTAECHIVPDNYANFSCGLNGICHEHDQSRMVSAHNEVSSFSYNASACYNCHPDGRAEDKLIPQNIIDKKQRHGLDNLENHR